MRPFSDGYLYSPILSLHQFYLDNPNFFFLEKDDYISSIINENLFISKEVSWCLPISNETLITKPLRKDIITRILVIKFWPKILNGEIDEMIRPRRQLSGSLIITELTNIYRFLLWKIGHFEKNFLGGNFAHITRNAE